MILAPEELTGKALDWAYEEALRLDTSDMRVRNGVIEIHLTDNDAVWGGSGWFNYKRRLKNEDDARTLVRNTFGDLVVVPTDLVSPRYADKTHESA